MEGIKYNDTGNGSTLAIASAWKKFINTTIGGVGMFIGSQTLKSLNSTENIQLWMMVATFNGSPSATILSCYSPTTEETDFITFYNELSYFVRSIPKLNVLVICGDINALIGKNVNHKFSLHNLSNRNWEYITDFPLENRLTTTIQNFKKGRKNYGHTTKQIVLKQRWNTSL